MKALSGKALIGGLAAFWLVFGGTGFGLAHQKDARLPALFDQLKAASNVAAAGEIEAKIWTIWLECFSNGREVLQGLGHFRSGDGQMAHV